MVFDSYISIVLGPILKLPLVWAILILSCLMSLLITIVYKYMTDQKLMKGLKDEMKGHQDEMKKHKDNPNKMLEVQKKAMDANMKYMMSSFKPTLVTMLPLLLIFGWMNAHLAYEPLMPNAEFTTAMIFDNGTSGEVSITAPDDVSIVTEKTAKIIDGKATWALKAPKGEYLLKYDYGTESFQKNLIISEDREYEQPITVINKGQVKQITMSNPPVKVLNIFGWQIGWLGTYLIFSIISSLLLRKLLNIH